jgi:hypothetical protein
MKSKLILNHTHLLAKGWYQRSVNLWEDYRRTITCDGHYTPTTRSDVAHILFDYVSENIERLSSRTFTQIDIMLEIKKKMLDIMNWDKRDLSKFTPVDFYDEAVILFCHYILEFSHRDRFDVVLSPSSKVLPLSLNQNETIEDVEIKIVNMFGKEVKPFDENDKYSKNTFEDLDSEYYNLDYWIKNGKLTYEYK